MVILADTLLVFVIVDAHSSQVLVSESQVLGFVSHVSYETTLAVFVKLGAEGFAVFVIAILNIIYRSHSHLLFLIVIPDGEILDNFLFLFLPLY